MTTIKKLYQIHDEASGRWFDIYQTECADGEVIEIQVPREERAPKAVHRVFLSKGASDELRLAQIEEAILSEAPCRTRVRRCGWRDDGATFVSPLHVSSARPGGPAILPPTPNAYTNNLREMGTLEAWRASSTVALNSTVSQVALGCVFAAPLIGLSGRSGFSIMLFGPSRCGKTTVAQLAASAMGYGQKNSMFTCDATHAGSLLAWHSLSDHLVVMDEAGTVEGSKKETYLSLKQVGYGASSGRDKTRHPSFEGDPVDKTFNVVLFMTSERSPDAWAALNGEQRDEGEWARLIALPALIGDSNSVWDRSPPHLNGEPLRAWQEQQCKLVNDVTGRNCGVAFRCYTDQLVAYPEEAKAIMNDATAYFVSNVCTKDMVPVARDIVASFALIYAGLRLAIGAEIVQLTLADAFNSIKTAALAAVGVLPDPRADLKAGLSRLRAKLESGSILSEDDLKRRRGHVAREADGYVSYEHGRPTYYVRKKEFLGWFPSPLALRQVLEWLEREGFLVGVKAVGQGRSIDWAATHKTWPDDTRARVIAILLPNGLDDLTSR